MLVSVFEILAIVALFRLQVHFEKRAWQEEMTNQYAQSGSQAKVAEAKADAYHARYLLPELVEGDLVYLEDTVGMVGAPAYGSDSIGFKFPYRTTLHFLKIKRIAKNVKKVIRVDEPGWEDMSAEIAKYHD